MLFSYKGRITEISTIHEICRMNEYPRCRVNKILSKLRNKLHKQNERREKREYRTTDFIITTSNIIRKHFMRQPYTPAFDTNNNIIDNVKRLSSNYKKGSGNRQDKYSLAGVNKIECKDCEESYIGKTEQSIHIRAKEHLTK
ncbi:unnamed protein product [Bemisia tabaci]|uniref:C2H2-type domain-containing protein n=1 Tax=Bemisia tabaci TaxID=7038 RepID=A0A9P0C8P9_BEMTA|nr:unnamed protein product [Bemisia tabaci]